MSIFFRQFAVASVILLSGSDFAPAGQPLSTAMTFQGQLKEDGLPALGDYDMQFTLFDALSNGNILAGPLDFDGVSGHAPIAVTNGLFDAMLDFGQVYYFGVALWLEIQVRPHGVGNYSALTPRQPLSAAPFASYAAKAGPSPLVLPFDGEASLPSQGLIDLENTRTTGLAFSGIFRIATTGDNSRAVTGLATAGSGITYGLYGQSNSTSGIGVYGQTAGPNGYAGYFVGGRNYFEGNVGIGTTTPASKLTVLTDFGSGVFARNTSSSGHGVFGYASATSGTNFGVYGQTASPSGYAGYFVGRGFFSDDVGIGTSAPTNRLSVSGSANITGNVGVGTSPSSARLHLDGGQDTSPTGGGFLVMGNTSAANISIDNNEIMARSNGGTSTLYLNAEGGDVRMGLYGIKPAHAHGKIDAFGNIIAASPNVTAAEREQLGIYHISIAGGVSTSDTLIATCNSGGCAAGTNRLTDARLLVSLHDFVSDGPNDGSFSFVIYRY